MKFRNSIIRTVACILLLFSICSACDDALDFTTDPQSVLSFSSDSIRFDTIITTVGSSRSELQVYNRNKKGLKISRVWLEKGSQTCFRVNVDGKYLEIPSGASVNGLEVWGGDSMLVIAEATLPARNQNEPFEMADRLNFQLESGVVQSVVVHAVGQDAYMWHGKVIERDTMLQPGRPYVVYDSLYVASGATLCLQPGVQLYFHDEAELKVRGVLQALGTREHPVVLRGDRTDRLFDYLPYDNTPSRWGGVRFYAESYGNKFQYTDLHSATYGILCDSASLEQEKLLIENSILHNIGGDGIKTVNCSIRVGNSQISNTKGYCVYQIGGSSEFVHCTLAQFYPWEAVRGQALFLSDKYFQTLLPLKKAHFYNCLITGYSDDVILGSLDESEKNSDYLFVSSVLNTPKVSDDARYQNCIFEEEVEDECCIREKGFVRFDTRNFLYDFTPDSCSPARSRADITYVRRYPYDRNGVDRMAVDRAAVGCYEFVRKGK